MRISWIGASAGAYRKGRAGFRPEAIVLHVMEDALRVTDAGFDDPASRVSTHYGVGRDGRTHQYVQEPDTAFHAGAVDRPSWPLIKPGINPNLYTIGIRHEGREGDPWPWPPAQLNASHRLVIAIAGRWRIPLDAEHVITRHAVRGGRTCPGARLDHAAYIAGLQAMAAGVPGGVAPGLPLRLRANARLRREPHTAAPILRVLSAGTTFLAAGSEAGEPVEGNAVWHRNPKGEFLWAGATDRPHAV